MRSRAPFSVRAARPFQMSSTAQIAMPQATRPGKIAGPYFWPGIVPND